MRFRKLRIAWSVVCGLLAVLLVALWITSYWRWDATFGNPERNFIYLSLSRGRFDFELVRPTDTSTNWWVGVGLWLPTLVCGVFAVAPWIRHLSCYAARNNSPSAH
jgi:hypothetical protein